MRISARILLFCALFVILSFSIFSRSAFAQTTNETVSAPATQQEALGTDSNVPTNLHNATQIVMIEAMAGVLCQLTGTDVLHPAQKCLGIDSQTGKIGFTGNGGGVIGSLGTMITYTLTPPISGRQYIAYLDNNFGLVKDANAANQNQQVCDPHKGVGFCGLLPIIDLWIAIRNIVYLIFILVFVIVGLGIMLRLHIDPQTVMSVQNQIPKIIIAIVAITFSFAIAGFLIDIMWVATYLFGSVIHTAAGGIPAYDQVIHAGNPFQAANSAIGIHNAAVGASDAFSDLIKSTLTGTAGSFGGIPFLGDIIIGIINILAYLIIAIAIIVALIRLWVILILSYLGIILDVVFAPFWILAGIVPGSPLGLGSWLRDLAANLAVFPMVIGFLLLGEVFISSFSNSNFSINRFTPPLLGGISSDAIAGLIGLGFLLMLPNMLTTMKAALKTPKLDLGPLIGPVGAGAKTLTGSVRGYGSTVVASREYTPGEGGAWEKRGTTRAFVGGLFGRR